MSTLPPGIAVCPSCQRIAPVIHVCPHIAAQVPPETTIPEVRQWLAEGRIMDYPTWREAQETR